jgi:hypothetical protein
MANPWLTIPLSDYEGHMAAPGVAQAPFLSRVLGELLAACPGASSVAVLGCAGGNGFEHCVARPGLRVVGVDLNPAYVAAARQRWSARLPGRLELLVGDVLDPAVDFAPVDLVYAGLVFEYVDPRALLARVRGWLAPGGALGVVLQLPDAAQAAVTPTAFASLERLAPVMRLHDEAGWAVAAAGWAERARRVETLGNGKRFLVGEYALARTTAPGGSCSAAHIRATSTCPGASSPSPMGRESKSYIIIQQYVARL